MYSQQGNIMVFHDPYYDGRNKWRCMNMMMRIRMMYFETAFFDPINLGT